MTSVRIIGIGNDYRRDDAAGLEVIRRLKERGIEPAALAEHAGESVSLLEAWRGAAAVILVDAVSRGAPAGTVHRLEAGSQPLPARFFRGSTHAFSLADAVELGRALRRLPQRVIVYGIEGREFSSGTGLTPEVARAVNEAAERIFQEFHDLLSQTSGSEPSG